MRLYLAGPMSGYINHNHDLFDRQASSLRKMGYEVLNPAELDNDFPIDPEDYSGFYKRDLPYLLECDAIAVLPGWSKSTGAKLEVTVAVTCGLRVLDALTLKDLPTTMYPSIVVPTT